MEVQKTTNQLLITALNSILFSQRFKHLLATAKFLVSIFSPLTVNEFSVHDSFSFADEVPSFLSDHFMASFDVESLFTNIPINKVIYICIDDLFFDSNMIHNLDRNDMRELVFL